MSGREINQHSQPSTKKTLPCVLDYEAQIVLPDEIDGFLNVARSNCIDADHWYIPLLTRNSKRSVEITGLDRPVWKSLPVGMISGPGLIRTPDTVIPASKHIIAVSCSGIVTWRGRWDRIKERSRNP